MDFLILFCCVLQLSWAAQPPHIVFILADDLGWNDVGFHGSDQIPTPNIDALAYNGVILNSHYSSPLCSPSRAALLTGKYPIHNGMHQNLILEPEPWGLPLSERTIPQYFSPLGYTSHVVGKWHLGYFKKAYTPTRRGFTSHFGFYNGYQDYYSHNVQASFVPYEGFDMRRNMEIAYNTRGSYSTDLFTEEAVRVIREHNANEKSLFLLLSHLAPHAGNYENPLQAPAEEIARFKCIKNRERRIYAAMVSKLDESVGKVMQALFNKGILNNTILVFLSDNGAPTRGIHPNHGSNWPLKGVKGTPWEGSSRTVALMWSFNLEKKKRISNQLMHITDWLPTLYSAAGGDVSKLRNLDGIDMWQSISRGYQAPRSRLLINIDPGSGYSALRSGKYKYINGTTLLGFLDHWSDKPGFGDSCLKYKLQEVLNSKAAKAISMLSGLTTKREVEALRRQATLNCTIPPAHVSSCQPLKQPCVFDVWQDPCETKNLYKSRPDIVKALEDEMEEYKTTMVKPLNKRTDKFANPRYWNNTWTYWQDFPPPFTMEAERKSWCLICY